MAQFFIAAAHNEEIDVLITSTYRDIESQNALYAIGRTLPGKRVTKAKGGQSFHNYRVAFDVVPVVGGKAMWDDEETWQTLGKIGVGLGLEWAGNWESFKEFPHFQFTNGLTLKDFQNGKTL
jgi:peptidoglycan L-alanyl-D-glutamate endopeptidase CwlK